MSAASDSEATISHLLTVRLCGLMALCYLLARKHVLPFNACQRAVSCRRDEDTGVADIAQLYREWSAKGAHFLTEPKDHGRKIRAYVRDPDGHLIEIGQATMAR